MKLLAPDESFGVNPFDDDSTCGRGTSIDELERLAKVDGFWCQACIQVDRITSEISIYKIALKHSGVALQV